MKYVEGLAIAQKYGLENEFNAAYNMHMEDAWYYGTSEKEAVLDALKEWDLAPEDAEVDDTLEEWSEDNIILDCLGDDWEG